MAQSSSLHEEILPLLIARIRVGAALVATSILLFSALELWLQRAPIGSVFAVKAVQVALSRFGAKAFQIESLWPADRGSASDRLANGIPFYERYGEQQVVAGVYTEVLRQRDHVEPLVMALRRHVRERTGCDLSLSS